MDTSTLFWLSFLAGIYASVGAPCALVLYPGYISFLAGRSGDEEHRYEPFTLGILVAVGVIVAMLTGGLIFSALLETGGGAARDIFTPIAFIILFFFSLLLIFDISFSKIAVVNPVLRLENPLAAAFFLGMTFGIIILPCNAAAVIVLLALAASAAGFFEGLGAFLFFGLGITLPLLLLAALSQCGKPAGYGVHDPAPEGYPFDRRDHHADNFCLVPGPDLFSADGPMMIRRRK